MAKEPRGRGRPTLLTSALADTICRNVRNGLPIELAAEACDVSRHTVYEWVRRGEGRDDDRPDETDGTVDITYAEFANRYRKARAEFARALMAPCLEAVAGKRPSKKQKDADGKPIMVKSLGAPTRANEAHWHLARRFPEFWGSGREMVLEDESALAGGETEGGVTIEVVLDKPSDPEAS